MTDRDPTTSVSSAYVSALLGKALTTARDHEDRSTRERAEEKLQRFAKVIAGMLDGTLALGSRVPVSKTPEWATLEVVKGGFATGDLLAAGPLQAHEDALLDGLGLPASDTARATLNVYHLGEPGLAKLAEMLREGRYRVNLPEEGALLVAAWLLAHDQRSKAYELLDVIAPYFDRLRFYPVPDEKPITESSFVRLQPVSRTVASLEATKASARVAAMNETLRVWSPFEDRLVALFVETFEGELPLRRVGPAWRARAIAMRDEYFGLRKTHMLCRRHLKPKATLGLLVRVLEQGLRDMGSVSGRDVGRLRVTLAGVTKKRGALGSETLTHLREAQAVVAALPSRKELANVLVERLRGLPQDGGLESLDAVTEPLSHIEAARVGARNGYPVPDGFRAKLERSLEAPIEALVERGVIPSGEVLAVVAPQITAQVRAAGIVDPELRRLYGVVYAAFRKRRSLLLLNLERQVGIEELPWVAAIERYRREGVDTKAQSRATLEQLATLAITSFPDVILPNKLLQELDALSKGADMELPLVEEIASDIFTGTFSGKFLSAAKVAARVLAGTVYERYYGLPAERVMALEDVAPRKSRWGSAPASPGFAELCAELAHAQKSVGGVARNGTIIEQELVLTTHNLAVLFDALGLVERLGARLPELAQACFKSVCHQHAQRITALKSQLQRVKNTAYTWRQMLFFLSVAPQRGVFEAFVPWAEEHFDAQGEDFRKSFAPAMRGLRLVTRGGAFDAEGRGECEGEARRFLGWTVGRHWLFGPDTRPKS